MIVPPNFRQEVERNLERIYVMEQRQFISMRLEQSERYPEGFVAYQAAVAAFNSAFDEHKACEDGYAADLALRTRDKALVLDKKHSFLVEKFQDLKPVVLAARKGLET